MELLIIIAGILLLMKVGTCVDRKYRKPPLRQLVQEFLYFDYENEFYGGQMHRRVFLAANKSKYQIACVVQGNGDVMFRYLGGREHVRFTEEELLNLTNRDLIDGGNAPCS